jgi:hypothetical protein
VPKEAEALVALNRKSVELVLLVVDGLRDGTILGGASARVFLADTTFSGNASARVSRAPASIFASASGADWG